MTNIKIIVKNDFDDASLATSPAPVSSLPASNMQRAERSRVMRSTSTTQTITATMPSARIANGFCIAGYSFTVTAQISLTLKLASQIVYSHSQPVTTALIPLGIWRAGIDPFGGFNGDQLAPIISHWFSPVLYDEAIIEIDDSGANSSGYFDIWRIYLGFAISPKINFSFGSKMTWQDNVEHVRTSAGSLRSFGDGRYRQISLNLDHLDDDDRLQLESELIKSQRNQDVLVSLYPDSGGIKEILHTMVAKRDKPDEFTHNYFNNNTIPLVFKEC